MAYEYNTTIANLVLDATYDTHYPAGSIVDIYSGAQPGRDAAATGTKLASIVLPAGPWAAAAAASKAKAGVWADVGIAAGNAGYFRLRNAANTKWEQGSITATGGGGDMTLDNINIAVGQPVTITTCTRTS